MDLDNRTMELAYGILVTIAWLWALSQWKVAITKPTGWRWSITFWLTAKAFFLTNAGIIWWFNWANPTVLEFSIYLLVVAHVVVFIHWLRLEDKDEGLSGLASRDTSSGMGLP